jgi:hypothetical protein
MLRGAGRQGYGGEIGTPGFKSFQNFLSNSASLVSNLTPDENGRVECTFDAHKYSTIVVLAMDDNSVTQSTIDIPSSIEEIEKRDLSLSTPLNAEKYYNEMRNTEILKKSDTHVIEDITSTDYIMVDSLEKVNQVQTEIAKAAGNNLPTTFEFLKTWDKLDEEKKNQKYSQFMCHEVNLFLYFKDRAYFDKVVSPFVTNKMEKTFIDLWLLGDEQEVAKFKAIDSFHQLNSLEK